MKRTLIILLFISTFYSCDLKNFEPGEVSGKIMITDNEGNILGGNMDNWLRDSVWLFELKKPLYPNPSSDGKCTLDLVVLSTFLARFEFDEGTVNEFYFPISGGPYRYILDGNAYNFRNQLRHLKIYLNGNFFTQGYLQFY